MESRPRVLVLTLYSGESEYERCRESMSRQTFKGWDHRVIEGLPNVEAHARLYETITVESQNYRLFFKLDADMVLADECVLEDLVAVFDRRPALDHLVVAVSDWMTQRPMIGAHMFSSRVEWRRNEERLYVDPDPEVEGEKIVIHHPPRDLILHAPDPTAWQAFHFGAHRALQASQRARRLQSVRAHNARIQWLVLDRVWRHFERTSDHRLGLAVLAADMVCSGQLPVTVNEYSDAALNQAFDEVARLGSHEIRARLDSRWGTPSRRIRTWLRSLGPIPAVLVGIRGMRDVAAAVAKRIIRYERTSIEIGTPD